MNDSVKWGPGVWFVLHFFAISSTDHKTTINLIKKIINNLPCPVCKQHALEFLKKTPIDDYVGVSMNGTDKIGLFVWTYKFHNAVNYRLGKPTLEWDVAYNLYLPYKN